MYEGFQQPIVKHYEHPGAPQIIQISGANMKTHVKDGNTEAKDYQDCPEVHKDEDDEDDEDEEDLEGYSDCFNDDQEVELP